MATQAPAAFHLLAKPTGAAYGRFLIDVFEEWVRRDVGDVYVQMFDVALANWVGEPPGLCVHSETCALLGRNRAPSEIVQLYAAEDARRGRNDPCTCGSGRKWKHCHGDVERVSLGVPGG